MQQALERLSGNGRQPEDHRASHAVDALDAELLEAYSRAVTRAAEEVSSSVVYIEAQHRSPDPRAMGREGERCRSVSSVQATWAELWGKGG